MDAAGKSACLSSKNGSNTEKRFERLLLVLVTPPAEVFKIKLDDSTLICKNIRTFTADGTFRISGFPHRTGDTCKIILPDSEMWVPLCKAEYPGLI
jgi:hypothetical protein